MSQDCVFCKIIAGELPATRVYEDDHVLAFLDIQPIIKGHALVIPKQHLDPITAAPPEVLAQLIAAVRKVAAAQTDGLHADGINVIQSNGACAGQIIPHLHFHVIPRFAHDGHSWNWATRKYADAGEMQRFGDDIRKALGD